MFKLYLTLRGQFKADLDDGFVNENQRAISSASRQTAKKELGNPLKNKMSKAYDVMLRCAEKDFERKTDDERARLEASVEKLRKLGVRFYRFVKKFGPGVLCLLPFTVDDAYNAHALAMSETEYVVRPGSPGALLTNVDKVSALSLRLKRKNLISVSS